MATTKLRKNMSITLIVRTVVPALWLSVVGWLLTLFPILEPLRETLLGQSELLIGVISALILGAWVAFTNWIAPKLPDWASGILMGSNKLPRYETIPGEFAEYAKRDAIPGTTLDLGATERRPHDPEQ